MTESASSPNLVVEQTSPDVLLVRLSGNWRERPTAPGLEVIPQALSEGPSVKALEFDTAGLTGWDSRFVAFTGECVEMASGRHIDVRCEGLPGGVRRLLRLAQVLPGKADLHRVVADLAEFLQRNPDALITGRKRPKQQP